MLNGTEDQPSKVDHRDCHVPRSLYMRRYLHQTVIHMIFSYLPPVHDLTLHPNHVGTCNTLEYTVALHQSRIAAAMYKSFYEPSKRKENSKQTLCDTNLRNIAYLKYHD